MNDFSVNNQGSIFTLEPNTYDAKEWVEDNIPNDTMYFGFSIVVEHRYISDIINGIINDGLTVGEI